jgi:hypothetical protein
MPVSSGMIRTIRGGRDDVRRVHTERRYLDPAKREARGHDGGDRDADHGEHDVDPVQREVALGEWRSGERHVVEKRSEDEEECEADCDAASAATTASTAETTEI